MRHKPESNWLQAYFKAKGLLEKKDEIEDLYLGLSYGEFGINPKYLTAPSYNLCMPSVDFYSCYKMYSYFSDVMPKLKNIYVSAAYYSAGFNLAKCTAKYRLDIYELFCGVKNPNTVENIIIKNNLSGLFKRVIPIAYFNGYEADDLFLSASSNIEERALGHYRQYNKYGTGELKWLRKLKMLTELNGHKMNVILFPFAPEYENILKQKCNLDLKTVNSTVLDFCKENGIDFIDLSCFDLKRECFYDYDHLSEKGAEIFTKRLDEYLTKQDN